MELNEPFQLVGQMGAPFGLSSRERLLFAVVGVGQMIGARQERAEPFAIGNHSTNRDPSKTHSMITALAANHALAGSLTAGAMISQRHFKRGIGGLGSGIAEESIVEIARRQVRQPRGELENLRV